MFASYFISAAKPKTFLRRKIMSIPFLSFGNEKELSDVGGLTIENQLD